MSDRDLWRAGPLLVQVPGVPAPAGFAAAGIASGAAFVVEVHHHEPGDGGRLPIDPITCTVGGPDTVRMHRSGGFTCHLDFGRGLCRYTGVIDVPPRGTTAVFESFLRALSASVLLRRGGALLHGASVAVDGRGYGFCGLSGAGKTTLVEGTGDDVFLADDQTIVSDENGVLTVWGSPFAGLSARRARPISAPLRALVLLSSERPTSTTLERRIDRARAAGELLRHLCCFEGTAAESARALAFVHHLVATIPVFSLARHIATSLDDVIGAIEADLSGTEAGSGSGVAA